MFEGKLSAPRPSRLSLPGTTPRWGVEGSSSSSLPPPFIWRTSGTSWLS